MNEIKYFQGKWADLIHFINERKIRREQIQLINTFLSRQKDVGAFTIYADNYKADVLGAYRDGYEKGQSDLIVRLADFLHVSLTFKNPVEVAKKLMEKE